MEDLRWAMEDLRWMRLATSDSIDLPEKVNVEESIMDCMRAMSSGVSMVNRP